MKKQKKNSISRRHLLKKSLHAGAGAIIFPTIIPASALGREAKAAPGRRFNIGVISCGNRSQIVKEYKSYGKSEIVAICDPREDRRLKMKEKMGDCDDYADFRELLARKDVDAVHISTPDHWHVPISLAAARAGKDMYTEKPLGISIEQDLAAKQIETKYNRIFQYGTQNRSMNQVRMGIELVLNGYIGEIKGLYVWCPPGHSGGSPTPELPVPKGFNYDLWLGPAPETPFCKDRCLSKGAGNGIFHIYDYALGFIGGWGAHPLDQMQWWADHAGYDIPVTYQGKGTIPTSGLFDTTTNWDMTCTYKNGFILRFLDNKTARKKKKIPYIDQVRYNHGTLFVGSKGWVIVSRGAWTVYPESLYKEAKKISKKKLIKSKSHTRNFINAVISRKQPISNLDSAIKSDLISQLCDISIRMGKEITWDPIKETIEKDEEAKKMMSRPMRAPWTL